jgi:hypothetical protein
MLVNRHSLFRFPALTLVLIACGCSGPPAPLTAVTGTVAFRGELLTSGTIVFTPDTSKGAHGPMAHAQIQPDGRFTLTTGDSAGAVAGWHRITVLRVREPSSLAVGAAAIPLSLLPEKYTSPESSTLSREVVAGVENVIHIILD